MAWLTLPVWLPLVKPISVPPPRARISAAAARKTVKVPLRWVSTTPSHSSSDMLNSIRSRRMPATQTTPSNRPQRSTAVATTLAPPAMVDTSSATAIASPPAASISLTTAAATSLVGLPPSMATP